MSDAAPRVAIMREPPDAPDARALIGELEAHLEPYYPPSSRHGFSVQRLLDEGVEFFIVRVDGDAAACGGILTVPASATQPAFAELKRMYVRPAYRGRGLGKRLVAHLGAAAGSAGIALLRLETGIHQHEAIGLYERLGFREVGPFPPYRPDPLSRFYERPVGDDRAVG